MKEGSTEIEKYRIVEGHYGSDASFAMVGAFEVPFESNVLKIISDDGLASNWEHVSVSLKNRCPNWKEMCFVKNVFWEREETVIQYHPPQSEYINNHPYVLHLWKPKKQVIPLPPWVLIGIKHRLTPT